MIAENSHCLEPQIPELQLIEIGIILEIFGEECATQKLSALTSEALSVARYQALVAKNQT